MGRTFELEEVHGVNGLQDGVRVQLEVELCGHARFELELFDEMCVYLCDASDQRTRHLSKHHAHVSCRRRCYSSHTLANKSASGDGLF